MLQSQYEISIFSHLISDTTINNPHNEPMKFQVFTHEGFNFSYSVEGSGPTILVPGGPSHYSQTFGAELKEKFRFIFIDHRGFALCNEINAEKLPSMEELVADLEAFRQHLNLESFYLLGHSGHCYLSLAYAKKHPQFVKGLLLLSAGPDLSPENRLAADTYFEEMADEKRKSIHKNNMHLMQKEMAEHPGDEFRIFCIRSAARSSFDPAFDPTPLWKSMHLNLKIVLHMWSHLFSKEIDTQALKSINLPIFIGMGLHDYQVPPHFTWLRYKEYIQQLTFRIFPYSGHNPQLEESKSFLFEIQQWIKKFDAES